MPAYHLPTPLRPMPLTPPDFIHYPLGAANLPPLQEGYLYDVGGYGYPHDVFEAHEVRKMLELRKKYTPAEMMPQLREPYPYAVHPVASRRGDALHGNAPVLPPIRIPEPKPIAAPAPKEEKVAGGVATHLDYEMEQMIDFVAEMAKGIVQPNAAVSTAFRNYVSQILTSTRLPSSTIMCALHYLAVRVTILSERGVFAGTPGHLYHLLTIGLMLASKFLDDNTFQNRSWAEVSHIAVGELNKHEREWLADIHWNLHVDTADPQGLFAWIQRWEAYKAKKVEMSLEALKLTPVDASLRMPTYAPHKYTPPTPVYTPSYEPAYTMDSKQTTPLWAPWPGSRALSPPSANPSGPTTPDWFGYPPRPIWGQPGLPPLSSIRSSAAPSPYYAQPPHQYPAIWGHGTTCGCTNCASRYESYAGPPMGMQPVMG